jgi:hypothetical protein
MVESIEINGVKYPVIVNFNVIGYFQKETGYSFDIIGSLVHMLYLVEPLLWYSLEEGHLEAKKEMTIKREDMRMLLRDNKTYETFFQIIAKFFPDTKEVDEKKAKKK